MKNLTAKEILDKAMGMRDFFNEADEKKILKAMKEYAKQEVAEASSDFIPGKNLSAAMKDHEFSIMRRDDDNQNFDEPTIKHFQD